MPQVRYARIDRRPRNPLLQVVGFVFGLAMLGAAIIPGGFLLIGLLGFLLIGAIVVYARLWWLRRKVGREGGQGPQIIETDYRVIDSSEPDDRKF